MAQYLLINKMDKYQERNVADIKIGLHTIDPLSNHNIVNIALSIDFNGKSISRRNNISEKT